MLLRLTKNMFMFWSYMCSRDQVRCLLLLPLDHTNHPTNNKRIHGVVNQQTWSNERHKAFNVNYE